MALLLYIIINLKCFCFVFRLLSLCMGVQHNGGFLPGIILLTQCYYHRGTRLNAIKSFCICSLGSHLPSVNVLTFPPLTGGCSEGPQ